MNPIDKIYFDLGYNISVTSNFIYMMNDNSFFGIPFFIVLFGMMALVLLYGFFVMPKLFPELVK